MSLIEYVLLGRNSYTNWFLSEDKKDYEIVEKALNKLNLQINEVNFSEQGCEVWDF